MNNKKELMRRKKQKSHKHQKRVASKKKAELVLRNTKEVAPSVTPEFDEREYTTAFGLMAELVQYIEMADVLNRIDPDKKYVVEIPAMLKDKFSAGDLFFNESSKTGNIFPTLMEMAEDGRKKFVGNMPMKDELQMSGKPMQEVAMAYHNIYTQRELTYIANTVEKTYRQVEQIEHGQMDDRIAKLQSGREQILLAMSLKDPEEKKQSIRLGRRDMIEAKNQIGKTLERRVREFEPVPKEPMKRLMKQVRDSGYLSSKDDEVEEIQDYYNLYLEATKLITASYIYSGEEEAARQVAGESKRFMKGIDFDNVKSIGLIHQENETEDMFFNAPVEYLEIEEKEVLENNNEETLFIEVDGSQLLEVLKDDTEEI
ncbi:MAG: hypothetical protein K6G64_10685 [Eubacterium sp.]|nr:hypothetical protein [Eubacterium sp.]